MTFCNLFARSLVMTFRMELSNEIGLKSLAEIGASFFGIRVMKESLILSKLIFPS
jgi:hypothetical protein